MCGRWLLGRATLSAPQPQVGSVWLNPVLLFPETGQYQLALSLACLEPRRVWRVVVCSALMVKAGRLHVALSYPSIPYPRQTLPSSVWKPLQRLPSQAEALPDAGPACPSHCQVFTCSVCQETFRRRMELRVHMVSHTGEMPYKVRPTYPRAMGCGERVYVAV